MIDLLLAKTYFQITETIKIISNFSFSCCYEKFFVAAISNKTKIPEIIKKEGRINNEILNYIYATLPNMVFEQRMSVFLFCEAYIFLGCRCTGT